MKNISVWWSSDLYDFYCDGGKMDEMVKWKGKGKLSEIWGEVKKSIGIESNLNEFWVDEEGDGWKMWKLEDDESEGGWYILEVDEDRSVEGCINVFGVMMWG